MKPVLVLMLISLMIAALGSCVTAQGYLEVGTSYYYMNESERCQGNGYQIDISVTNLWGNPIEINQINVQMDWQSPTEYHTDHGNVWLDNGQSHDTSIYIIIPFDASVGDHQYHISIVFDIMEGNNTVPGSWQGDWYDFYVESYRYQEAHDKRQEAMGVMDNLNMMMFESREAADKAMQANDAFSNAEGYYNSNDYDNAITEYNNAINLANEAISLENSYDPSGDGSGDGDGDGGGDGGLFGGDGISIDWSSIDGAIPPRTMVVLFLALLIGLFVIIPVVYFFVRK